RQRTKSAAPVSTTDRLRRNGTFALSNAFSIVRKPITLPRLVLAGRAYSHLPSLLLTTFEPTGSSEASLDLPIGLSHRPRDESVVSSLHCMNDPQPEGHMASYFARRKFLATLGGAAAWPLAVLPMLGSGLTRSLRTWLRAIMKYFRMYSVSVGASDRLQTLQWISR